ncbi:MAG: lamin tail domain-containing protein, partial [Deltaproteobacteria bacterium]|nr:lamin tail domain-containing protein [Deltaproteobacteria bacterium]MBW2532307.1 lamin tail domain-containing protein [Deltaproteobacteria bacterium]
VGGAGGAGGSGQQCGNGWVEGTEDCDGDGAGVPGETAQCDSDCSFVECGDDLQNVTAGEQCDDANPDSFDGCSATCRLPVSHLLLSEVMAAPSEGEFVEIYNPTSSAVSLDQIYLSDYSAYYEITQGTGGPIASDFRASFPPGHSIPAGGFIVVAVRSATEFQSIHGAYPDFDLDPGDLNAPHMLGNIGGSVGLTNSAEMLVLFTWDGSSDLVGDLDYLVYGNTTNGMDKSGIVVGSGTYANETSVAGQIPATAPAVDKSLHRCHTSEFTETPSGGNGATGHDETSENLAAAWKVADLPTPGLAPTTGFCAP